jgi:hypothetical protein
LIVVRVEFDDATEGQRGTGRSTGGARRRLRMKREAKEPSSYPRKSASAKRMGRRFRVRREGSRAWRCATTIREA